MCFSHDTKIWMMMAACRGKNDSINNTMNYLDELILSHCLMAKHLHVTPMVQEFK